LGGAGRWPVLRGRSEDIIARLLKLTWR